MKKLLILLFSVFSFSVFSQEFKKPSEGKSMVYFVRTTSLGFLINFKYFDNEKYLGKFNYGKYIAYECEPGKHLFWSKSENIDFIEAELEANKIYIIDSEPQMGAIKAGVKLVPFVDNVSNFKNEKKYLKTRNNIISSITEKKEFILNKDSSDQDDQESDYTSLIKKSIERYNERKSKNKEITQITNNMYLNN